MPKTILLVEDNANIRLALSTFLGIKGYTILEAKNRAEARGQIKEGSPDLIISDLNLPDGSGIQLLDEFTPKPKAIALSGHTSETTQKTALDGGFRRFLTKPVDLTRILTVVEEVLAE